MSTEQVTPGCAKAIDSYLEYRQRYAERIKEDDPLIREEFDINDEIHESISKIKRQTILAMGCNQS